MPLVPEMMMAGWFVCVEVVADIISGTGSSGTGCVRTLI